VATRCPVLSCHFSEIDGAGGGGRGVSGYVAADAHGQRE
jgi:hypothetical protein